MSRPRPKHCPEQREEVRDPSNARRVSGTSCSMTRASSSKARACDIQIFCQTIFALASFEKEHETSATPRSAAGGDAHYASKIFSRTDLSSPEGSMRRHCGPRSCPESPRLARPEGCVNMDFICSPIWVGWLVWMLCGPDREASLLTLQVYNSTGAPLPSAAGRGLSRSAIGRTERTAGI